MRLLVTTFASLLVATSVGAAEPRQVDGDAPITTTFLDFGVPCKDPLPEVDSSKPAGPQLSPKSDPANPLTQPNYPPISRRLGEEGTAVVRLLIAESGEVSQAEIAKSTGSTRLDEAALEGTRNWHLQPGTLKGKPRCMWGKFGVSFVLTDYTDEELRQVVITSEARNLAHHLMGMQRLTDGSMTGRSTLSAVERNMIEAIVQSAARSKELLGEEDRVARILALEFSTTELAELSRFFASPVAAKWLSLDSKMMPSIHAEQRLATQTLLCSMQVMHRALQSKELSEVEVDGKITEQYQQAIPQLADAAMPFCDCLVRRHGEATASQRKTAPQNCGEPPTFTPRSTQP